MPAKSDSPAQASLQSHGQSGQWRFSIGARRRASNRVRPSPKSTTHPEQGPKSQLNSHADHLVLRISTWLQNERSKHHARVQSRHANRRHGMGNRDADPMPSDQDVTSETGTDVVGQTRRRSSDLPDHSFALEALQEILDSTVDHDKPPSRKKSMSRRSHHLLRHHSSRKETNLLPRQVGTLTGHDASSVNELLVPSAEVVLDNTKIVGLDSSMQSCSADESVGASAGIKDMSNKKIHDPWSPFKHEVLRLTHTLQISGWRRIKLESSNGIKVEKLSGALTNAVYVVHPPPVSDTTQALPTYTQKDAGTPRKRPKKLLLRIYGPNVSDLIDRGEELQVLCRLAQKSIGPRLLGTFANGRFEEYFHAQTLTAPDLKKPEIFKQIAKRMKELHDGIELRPSERAAGASVWRNWEKWSKVCAPRVKWLDENAKASLISSPRSSRHLPNADPCRFVCGTDWSTFERTVKLYRQWLYAQSDHEGAINQRLVFAHNDTQYGNLLRLQPSGESPLLHPANEHRQLVVIDFEYAAANLPGLEFANHFTEWCYNYDDHRRPFALRESDYPCADEQEAFVRAYVQHTLPVRPTATPQQSASDGGSTSISAFMLDSRLPPAQYGEDEMKREAKVNFEIRRLQQEARTWRAANSAQWVVWGIVQAKLPPEFDDAMSPSERPTRIDSVSTSLPHASETCEKSTTDQRPLTRDDLDSSAPVGPDQSQGSDVESVPAFDYLAYAHERALLFWGDIIQLGLVKPETLPSELLKTVKTVKV